MTIKVYPSRTYMGSSATPPPHPLATNGMEKWSCVAAWTILQHFCFTPPDTWSCPTLGLASVLMSRPISLELVLSPDF